MKMLGNYYPDHFIGGQDVECFSDARLAHLPSEHFLRKEVLDIGCGEAFLTIELAIRYLPQKIVALDIDNRLLERARKRI